MIALTGATGFLGRRILHYLAAAGHEVRCWKRPTSNLAAVSDIPGAIEWIDGALTEPTSIAKLVDGARVVVHAALARSGGFRDAGKSDLVAFVEQNVVGSLRLMDAAHRAGVERFVFISTCAVHEVILADRPLDETHPTWSTSHYGAHKAAIEAFVASFGHGQGWPICSLRPCGIYGMAFPAEESDYYDLVGEVLAGRPVKSDKGGKVVHVDDVAAAVGVLLKADAKTIAGQAYNCCDRYVSEAQVATIAKELTGGTSTIETANKGPKNVIVTKKLEALGMKFGGEARLRETVSELIAAHR